MLKINQSFVWRLNLVILRYNDHKIPGKNEFDNKSRRQSGQWFEIDVQHVVYHPACLVDNVIIFLIPV